MAQTKYPQGLTLVQYCDMLWPNQSILSIVMCSDLQGGGVEGLTQEGLKGLQADGGMLPLATFAINSFKGNCFAFHLNAVQQSTQHNLMIQLDILYRNFAQCAATFTRLFGQPNARPNARVADSVHAESLLKITKSHR